MVLPPLLNLKFPFKLTDSDPREKSPLISASLKPEALFEMYNLLLPVSSIPALLPINIFPVLPEADALLPAKFPI